MKNLGAEALHTLARCSTSLDDQGSQASAKSTRRTELIALRPVEKDEEEVLLQGAAAGPAAFQPFWIRSEIISRLGLGYFRLLGPNYPLV